MEECLDLLVEAIATANYAGKVLIALDVAASEFHCEDRPGYYDLDKKSNKANHQVLSGECLKEYYLALISKYPSTLVMQSCLIIS